MGLLKADQLRNYAGTGNADLFKQWASKAWANLNGTGTIAINASRNVASAIDHGVADYSFNFTSLLNGTYSGLADGVQTGGFFLSKIGSNHTKTSSNFRIGVISSSGNGSPPNFSAAQDMNQVDMAVQGDLA